MPGPPAPAGYRPHTVYLTDATWQELDRRWAERRSVDPSLSKIGFVERVVTVGLSTLGKEAAARIGVEKR